MRIHFFATAMLAGLLASEIATAKDHKQKQLPPGLEKKAQSGQALPPGWQKKLAVGSILDRRVYENSQVILRDDKGIVTIRAEGKLIRLLENTYEIVEILDSM